MSLIDPPVPSYQTLLSQSGIDPVDARALLQSASARTRAWLIAHAQDTAPPDCSASFLRLAERRRLGEPVAYLLNEREFYSRVFTVSPSVLIPRPETECLVERVLKIALRHSCVLDVGTGSGCIAISLKLERPDLSITATDVSPTAIRIAQHNASQLGADIDFVVSNWFNALQQQSFDLIVANPPYIAASDPALRWGDLRFEPRAALTDEADGLGHIAHIVSHAPYYLTQPGVLLFEHGHNQGGAIRRLLAQSGFSHVQTWTDLAGVERISSSVYSRAPY